MFCVNHVIKTYSLKNSKRKFTFLKYSFFEDAPLLSISGNSLQTPSLDDIFFGNFILSNSIILVEDLIRWNRGFETFLIGKSSSQKFFFISSFSIWSKIPLWWNKWGTLEGNKPAKVYYIWTVRIVFFFGIYQVNNKWRILWEEFLLAFFFQNIFIETLNVCFKTFKFLILYFDIFWYHEG